MQLSLSSFDWYNILLKTFCTTHAETHFKSTSQSASTGINGIQSGRKLLQSNVNTLAVRRRWHSFTKLVQIRRLLGWQ